MITDMRYSFPSKVFFILVTLLLCFTGCRNLTYWKKNDSKPQKNTVFTNDADVMAFNDFRTIDASMIEPSVKSKKNKSLLWENTQARDIERRLGVQD